MGQLRDFTPQVFDSWEPELDYWEIGKIFARALFRLPEGILALHIQAWRYPELLVKAPTKIGGIAEAR